MLNFLCWLGRRLLALRYRVRLSGLDEVARRGTRGILFLPNHPALIDPAMVVTALRSRFRPMVLADKDRMDIPGFHRLSAALGVKPILDPAQYGPGSRAALDEVTGDCIATLRRGENLLFWPAGRIYRSRYEDLGGNSLVETMLRAAPDIRVVLVRTRGLWGSRFGRAPSGEPRLFRALGRGVLTLLANGLFFAPRREVSIELVEPDNLPRGADRAALNRYLEEFYNRDAPPNTRVPDFFWRRGGARIVPEPDSERRAAEADDVSGATRKIVLAHLKETAGAGKIKDSDNLARDLNLDSLARAELGAWLEGEFGFAVTDSEALQTVGDALMAARGAQRAGRPVAVAPPPPRWFAGAAARPAPTIPEGASLAEVFLAQALRAPGRPAVADRMRGVLSYRDLLTAIMLLKPALAALEGEYLGIMLPASSGAVALYLAVMFAGKIPVMLNWTAGVGTLARCLDRLGIRRVLTAQALVSRLTAQGLDLAPVADRLLMIEDVGRRLGTFAKLAAWLRARFNPGALRGAVVADTAAVLFTSGSESFPKAVPLTHANILANIRDIFAFYRFRTEDCMLGMLPPFHSFGLTCSMLFPLCAGLRAVFYPNPTEGAWLAAMIESYGVTLLMGTPTFLSGIIRSAADNQLKTLRLVVAGAEKCPAAVYESVARRWPRLAILEGYGITECSPVISGNDEMDPRPGAIGRVLPSLEYAVRDLDTGARAPAGRTGMLLVRGPSVFGGYLRHDGPSPFEEFEGRLWYRTGDLVQAGTDGVLTFSGRLKRFVKLGGEMISLPAVEEVLLTAFASDADQAEGPLLAVDGTPAETNPDLVLFTAIDITREAANRAIRAAGLSPLHNIREVRRLENIPTLGTGKTDYRALRNLLDGK